MPPEKSGIDGNEKGNRHQETEHEFQRGAGVFKCLTRNFRVRPEEAAHIGDQPKSVNTECDHQQRGASNEQAPIETALPEESRAAARRDPACVEGWSWPAGIMAVGGAGNVVYGARVIAAAVISRA